MTSFARTVAGPARKKLLRTFEPSCGPASFHIKWWILKLEKNALVIYITIVLSTVMFLWLIVALP
jgi:hypothetical protein